MNNFEQLVKDTKELIQKRESVSGELIVSFFEEHLISLRDNIKRSKKYKTFLMDLEKIPFRVPEISKLLRTDKKGKLINYEGSGLYKLPFSEGGFIYILKYLANSDASSPNEYTTLGFATEGSWKTYIKIRNRINKAHNKPKKGIYKVYFNDFTKMVHYKRRDPHKFPKTRIIHPVRNLIFDDIDAFIRDGKKYYQQFNLPFLKKTLLVGKTGTGKTSIARLIASSYGSFCNVVWAENFNVLQYHLLRLEKFKVPSIIIYEDCESDFEDAGSEILNFLDGIDLPFVREPAYLIFTTNYPASLKERIRRRFDRVFHVGPLQGEHALECARSYFDNYYSFREEDKEIFSDMTGWEIWRLWIASRNYCISNKSDISIDIIQSQKKKLKAEFKMMEEEEKKKKRIGFGNDLQPF